LNKGNDPETHLAIKAIFEIENLPILTEFVTVNILDSINDLPTVYDCAKIII